MQNVGIIGTGLMGTAIARRLLEVGNPVGVWNRTISRCEPLRERGGYIANSTVELFERSGLIILVTATTSEASLILEAAGCHRSGKDVINFVTGSPVQIRGLGAIAVTQNARLLSGTLLCYPGEIGAADALIICGGDASLWSEREALLKKLGGNAQFAGTDPAIPNVMDAAITGNFFFGALAAGLEAAEFIRRNGAPLETFRALLNQSLQRLPVDLNALLDAVTEKELASDQATMEVYARSQKLYLAAYRDVGAPDAMIEALTRAMSAVVAEGRGHLGLAALY